MKTDGELQRDVMAELAWEPSVNAAQIGVAVKGGVVTLTGHVPHYSEKYAAERAAGRVRGVRAVADELDVRLPGGAKRTDEDIAADCARILAASYAVPDEKVKAVVSDGRVWLEGEVDRPWQRAAAERAIRDVTGVRGVTNAITVTPRVSPADVKREIEAALKRNAETEARRIKVESTDGKVTLRGDVHAWFEKQAAARAAWAALGVTSVENLLEVTPEH